MKISKMWYDYKKDAVMCSYWHKGVYFESVFKVANKVDKNEDFYTRDCLIDMVDKFNEANETIET